MSHFDESLLIGLSIGVICPTCGAMPGEVCMKKYGGSAPTHKPRARLARLTWREVEA